MADQITGSVLDAGCGTGDTALFLASRGNKSHVAWESLWMACGRKGAVADFLKGLIKLAAAGVNVTAHTKPISDIKIVLTLLIAM